MEEAEAFYGGALELRERVLGPGHPATASSLNNLAVSRLIVTHRDCTH